MSQSRWLQTLSCEFFPPITTEGVIKLQAVREQLLAMRPAYFSVTYGAGGSTRDRTVEVVLDTQAHSGVPAAPHLTCIASTQDSVRDLLNHYRIHGIRRIVALRGDMPSGMRDPGEFRYANELVSFIRAEFGDQFHIEVAAYPEYHPQAPSPEQDFANFKRKVEAGADSAITQYFYNADAYFRFIDQCATANINVPVVPGIMPIYNITQLARFSSVCGAEIPRWLKMRLEEYGDDIQSLRAFGIDVVSELCAHLLESGVPSLHFYTLNQAGIISNIIENISAE